MLCHLGLPRQHLQQIILVISQTHLLRPPAQNVEGRWRDVVQHHVQAGPADDVDTIFGQEKKARFIVAGHILHPGSLNCENAVTASVTRLPHRGLDRFPGIAFDRLTKLEIDLVGNGHDTDEQHAIVNIQQVFMQGVEDADLQHPGLFD